jgi:hypothetical protein
MKSKLTVALLATALVALAIPALSAAGRNTIELESKLKGKYVVDGGIKKGGAKMHIFLKPTQEKLCFEFEAKKLDSIIYGAIHKGAEGELGKEKVTLLDDPAGIEGTGAYEGCVKNVKAKLLEKIAAKPEAFYADLDTMDYPDGAVRGQLALTEPADDES